MDSQNTNENQSVFEHVGALRDKIFIGLIAFSIAAVICHIFNHQIIAFILKPAGSQNLIFLSPLDPLLFIFKIDLLGGLVISFPVIIWCIFSFITPALSKKVSKLVVIFYITSTLLLLLGLAYAFFVTIPLTLRFLFSITIPGIENSFSASDYLNFLMTQAIIIISVFQVPILVVGGVYLGILKTKIMSGKRRYIYVILLTALAIITPTTDVFSLMIVFVPCIVIFEISLIGGRIVEAKKKK